MKNTNLFNRNVKLEDTYNDRELEKALLSLSKQAFDSKTDPSLMLARTIGNTYTASLYGCLISYLLRYSSIDKPNVLNNI